jgi:hypothetical protein
MCYGISVTDELVDVLADLTLQKTCWQQRLHLFQKPLETNARRVSDTQLSLLNLRRSAPALAVTASSGCCTHCYCPSDYQPGSRCVTWPSGPDSAACTASESLTATSRAAACDSRVGPAQQAGGTGV